METRATGREREAAEGRATEHLGTHERVVTYTQKHGQYSYGSGSDIDKEPPNHLLQARACVCACV